MGLGFCCLDFRSTNMFAFTDPGEFEPPPEHSRSSLGVGRDFPALALILTLQLTQPLRAMPNSALSAPDAALAPTEPQHFGCSSTSESLDRHCFGGIWQTHAPDVSASSAQSVFGRTQPADLSELAMGSLGVALSGCSRLSRVERFMASALDQSG